MVVAILLHAFFSVVKVIPKVVFPSIMGGYIFDLIFCQCHFLFFYLAETTKEKWMHYKIYL